jgi:hypothetical protein
MGFSLGVITGILISILVFLIEISLQKNGVSIIKSIKKLRKPKKEIKLKKDKPKETGAIIGMDEEEEARAEIFERNAREGKDTNMKEIWS